MSGAAQRRAWTAALRPGASAPATSRSRQIPAIRQPRPVAKSPPLTLKRLLDQVAQVRDRDRLIPAHQRIAIDPVPKPRMTSADRWIKRPPVLRYRAFADELRLRGVQLPAAYRVHFILPMPDSWPESWKSAMDGLPHLLVPDASNLTKALEDALVPNDQILHCIAARKTWGRAGAIVIEHAITEDRSS